MSEHADSAVSRKLDAILAPWKRAAGYLLALALGGGAGSAATGLVGPSSTDSPATASQVAEVVPPETDRKCASSRDVRLALDWLRAIAEGLRAAGIAIEEPPPNTIPVALQGRPSETK